MHRFRAWMDKERFASNSLLTTEYAADLMEFMTLATNQACCLESDKDGILPYKVWYNHGESDTYQVGSSSRNVPNRDEESTISEEAVDTVQMVQDAYRENI
ncbi:unnamed protein product [Arabidopsis thaliana]|uniref:Uncharacterized protein n=1 Tax=Arabidopsis thaliana TaxID=3702 RepID=A0A654ES89_ARATH|nr:unnamed protein product [Arabidopsis thaliana]